ncbi:NAD(P)/FAD-dependent oxidoreductase [Tumebacillus avium]|uniref:NAD(P)/FAD-dependent oxidoreductase n=1 Tax=Tumebacillus avium TaxID=1903704 RepID=UPI0012FD961C|nr:NAD(P)/FAD-dependent oxidoreductase [Tumebacillus avium]
MKTYDAIVVGARNAGATLAAYLGKSGLQVLLVDRSFFPSDVISTHTIFNNTVETLRDLGVMERLLTDDAPPIGRTRAQFNDAVIEGQMPVYGEEADSYCFRRTHFDKVLLDFACEQPGVTAVEGFRVTDLLREGDTVVGVRGQDREGNVTEYRARIVIGADGRNSIVRKAAGAVKKTSTPSQYASLYAYFSNVEQMSDEVQFELYTREIHRAYLFPTSNQQVCVVMQVPLCETGWIERFKREPEQAIRDYYKVYFPRPSERIADAVMEEPLRGLYSYENYWYEGMGQGWALVGDAICFKDPGVGQGMHDAIFGARMLSELLAGTKDWEQSWQMMAEQYQTRIENEFMARYHQAVTVTQVAPLTEQDLGAFQLIASSPLATEKFLGFFNYTAEQEDLGAVLQTLLPAGN